eukprot:Blabericola_migrator_1__9035@NODE_480_length_8144_cov_370_014362_g305_i1_p1_GENE_NODE_480_length_8144_cov_370_014362_g305_i1NODE_480_length_8144_cov_370_014362_g305_i1_p1_ORF_typecomplete_len496_score83_47MFS_1/PF07690_16/1_2e03MFS_1/PF07690_16/4e15MFS_1/PF07690_16/1e07Sugar_tr/PF00083_24/4_8e09NADHdh_A3/PF14987_6/3_7e03NADHdh_A3/PF14987_6/14NADHdh_A3/PF14987_6/2_1e02ER_lumen_recept/PF00810_18/5_6e03ER_lumen_recept/PF00810_18/7_9e02ER_lumen_recept/PF00810_18/2_5e03ER_lumen_recept/PF00810_18/0_22
MTVATTERKPSDAALSTQPIKTKRKRQQTKVPFGINRYVLMVLACISCIFNGPIVMNTSPIKAALVQSGAYGSLCNIGDEPENGTNCHEQNLAVTALLNYGGTAMFVCSVVAGIVVDMWGPKVSAVIGNLIFALSYLLFAISNESRRLYQVAWTLNGAAVEFCFFGVLTIPNLFPQYPRLGLAILGTFRSLAMCYNLVMEAVVTDNFTFMKACWVYMCISLAWGVIHFFMCPNEKYYCITDEETATAEDAAALEGGKETSKSVSTSEEECSCSESLVSVISEVKSVEQAKLQASVEWKMFLNRLISPLYIIWLVVFAMSYSRGLFYAYTIETQQPDVVTAFGILSPLSFIPCPFLGIAADTWGMTPVLIFLNTMGLIMYICLLIGPYVALEWISVLCATILLSFLASQNYCYVTERYREEAQGKLAGFAMAIAGALALVVTPLVKYASTHDNGYRNMNIMFLCITCALLAIVGGILHPFRKRTKGPTREEVMGLE